MKSASVSLIVALMLLFSFALTGCTWTDNNDNATPTASPTVSPQVTDTPTPGTGPEVQDDNMPDGEDGVVNDEDGIITEDDTGSDAAGTGKAATRSTGK